MRISTQNMFQRPLSALLERQSALSRTQNQLATGKAILSPSDDPAASTRILELKNFDKLTSQYQGNLSTLEGRLSLVEHSLDSGIDALQRSRELVIRAGNASLSDADRDTIASEIDEQLSILMGAANTKDGNGELIFAGFNSKQTAAVSETSPGVYSYNGDQGERSLQSSQSGTIRMNDNGFDLFMNIEHSSGTNQSVFDTLNDISTELRSNTLSADTLTDIDSSMNSLLNTRTSVGARLNAVDAQKDINDAYQVFIQSSLSEIEDLDYAEAFSRFSLESVGLEAAQKTFSQVQNLSLFNFI